MSCYSKNWNMSDVECDSILSHDCSDDVDSFKKVDDTIYQE